MWYLIVDTNYFHEYDREMGHYFSLNFKNNCSWTEIILFVHKFKEKKTRGVSEIRIRIRGYPHEF